MKQQHKAIVIGSGVAGLAAAIRLTLQDFDVEVFEQNAYPGGKLSMFEKDGFRFDAGPSLFTQPQNIEQLFADAGEKIADYFQYEQVLLSCKYFYENGKQVEAWTDADMLSKELHEQLGEDQLAVKNYLSASARLYNKIGTVFLNHSLHKKATWINKNIPPALRAVKFGYLFDSLHRYNQSKFQSEEAVQLFNRFATYNGSNPYQTPGMMSLIPHLELNEGTFYPRGGMISITHALYRLALKKGVRFHFHSPVQRIIHHQSRVRGVTVNNENVFADVVVSNADVYFTYKQLLGDDGRASRVLKQERSCSGIIFYWGMKKQFPQLHLHNIFFSKNYKAEFENIFRLGKLYNDPTVYINITSKMETGHAPAGKENWFILVNAPSNKGQQWNDMRLQLREQVIAKLSRLLNEDIAAAIETEDYLDPLLIESKTGSYMGALYGTSSNSKMAAFLRHANFTSAIHGLYFCGGSVHPGGGIPLCFKSAAIVSKLIQKDKQKLYTH
jgi:phytoene desaturase